MIRDKRTLSSVLAFVGEQDLCDLLFICKTQTCLVHEHIAREMLRSIEKSQSSQDQTLFTKFDKYKAYDEGLHCYGIDSDVYDEHALIHLLFSCAMRDDVRILSYILQDEHVQEAEKRWRRRGKVLSAFVSIMDDPIDDEGNKGITLLQYAASIDADKVAQYLINHGVESVDSRGVFEMTPVLFASMGLSNRTLEKLLTHSPTSVENQCTNVYGWQSYCPFNMGIYPIHAIFLGTGSLLENQDLVCYCLQLLLSHHCNVDARTGPLTLTDTYFNLDTRENEDRFVGFTALHLAVITKNLRAVKMLIDAGAKQYRLEKEDVDTCVPTSKEEAGTFEDLFDDEWRTCDSMHSVSSTGDSAELDEETEEMVDDKEAEEEEEEMVDDKEEEEEEDKEAEEEGEEEEKEGEERVDNQVATGHVSSSEILIVPDEGYITVCGVPMRRLALPLYLCLAKASMDADPVWMEMATYLRDHASVVLTVPHPSPWKDQGEQMVPEGCISAGDFLGRDCTIDESELTYVSNILGADFIQQLLQSDINTIVWANLLTVDSELPENMDQNDIQEFVEEILASSPRDDLSGFICTRYLTDTDIEVPPRFSWEIVALLGRLPELRAMFPAFTEDELTYAYQYVRTRDLPFAAFIAQTFMHES